jgi:hypothetical protein
LDLDRELVVADVIVDVHSTFGSTEQDSATIRRPLDELEADLELLTPETGSFNRPDNNSSVFINNADLFSVGSPAHVSYYTLVSVVDHLFKPVLLVHHPDDNQTCLIGGGQLLVLVVPLNDLHVAFVALKVLVHAEVATSLALSGLKLKDFE